MNLKTFAFCTLFFHLIYAQGSDLNDEEYSLLPPIFHIDDFDRCMLLGQKAHYCTIELQLKPTNGSKPSQIWRLIEKANSKPENYRHDLLRVGVCVSTACPGTSGGEKTTNFTKSLKGCLGDKYTEMGMEIEILNKHCQTNEPPPVDGYDIAVGIILVTYFAFVVFASFYEGRTRYKSEYEYNTTIGTTFGKILAAFSIPKNFYRLKNQSKDPDTKTLRFIQGIRFFNMVCVIMCHTIMVAFMGPIINTRYPEKMTENFLNMFLANGGYAVQTFFVISSWLLAYNFFKMLEGQRKFKISYLFWAFINRYIRLTPSLAVVVALHSTWLIHAARGPFWDKFIGEEYRNCRRNGWTNLLHINNYVRKENMCLQQTWYIAADTQLFICALVVVTIMWKFQNKIHLILGILLAVGVGTLGVISYVNDYDIVVRQYPENLYRLLLPIRQWHEMYTSAYSNIGGYVLGLWFGYLFYRYRRTNLVTRKIYVVLWWILSFGLCIFIVLIAGPMYAHGYKYSRFSSALYWAFGKNLFAFGICVGMFGLTQKIGWFARWVLQWKALVPLGRLTFSAYLIHVGVVKIKAGYMRTPVFVADYIFFTSTLGDVALSYLSAFVLCILVEMPISALQKLMVPQMNNKGANVIKDGELIKEVKVFEEVNLSEK